ncbi:MAG: hypothetical protein HY548_05260 [Elusimicrobia bacterium]|nr:hypothetical protein [Elusimicrobiota bacterium]
MHFLKKLFGSRKPKDDTARILIRKQIEGNLAIFRYVATCGKFDRQKVEKYFALAREHLGTEFNEEQKSQMLNADTLLLPEGDIDGFEQVRKMCIATHAEALRTFMNVLKGLEFDEVNVLLMKRVVEEMDSLAARS